MEAVPLDAEGGVIGGGIGGLVIHKVKYIK